MDSIAIFCDGACSGNPGPGGWGVLLVKIPDGRQGQAQVLELGGASQNTTNNQMELTAVGKALRHIESIPGDVTIYTDSTYVIQGITKWIWGWFKRGWKTSEGGEVANVDYWKRLSELVRARESQYGKIKWGYVRGHSGVAGNERVDEIAVAFSKGEAPVMFQGDLSRYRVGVLPLPEVIEVPAKSTSQKTATKNGDQKPWYLSYADGKVKRHKTWSECEAVVKGRSGVKYKKIGSKEEESEILASWGLDPAAND